MTRDQKFRRKIERTKNAFSKKIKNVTWPPSNTLPHQKLRPRVIYTVNCIALTRRSKHDYSRGFSWVFRDQPNVLSDLNGKLRNYNPHIKAGCICKRMFLNSSSLIISIISFTAVFILIAFTRMICLTPLEVTWINNEIQWGFNKNKIKISKWRSLPS